MMDLNLNRNLANVRDLPGVMVYDSTRKDALRAVEALALREQILADENASSS